MSFSSLNAAHSERTRTRVRVLQLTVGFTVGGAEILLREMCRLMDRSRFEVEAACLKGDGPLRAEIERAGTPAFALGGVSKSDLAVLWRLYRLLRSRQYDVIHSHLYRADVAARVVGRLAGVPVILSSQHDTDLWMKGRHVLACRLTLPLADRVASVSRMVQIDAMRRFGLPREASLVIHNGTDLTRFDRTANRPRARKDVGVPIDRFVVGFVGRLQDEKKGVSVLLRAFELLRRGPSGEGLVLVILGDGPDAAALKECAGSLGVASDTMFLGERGDAASVYPAFDVLAVPSLYEGFGLVCLEGMTARLPVVASRVGGIPEVVLDGETGTLVPPGKPVPLADAIARYRNRPDLVRAHGEAGRRRVEKCFTIERMVRSYEELYLDLIARAGDRSRPGRGDRAAEAAPCE